MEIKNSTNPLIDANPESGFIPYKTENKKKYIIIAISCVIVIVLGYFLFLQYNEIQKYKEDKDIAYLKSKIESHLILPSGEPLIATINNIDDLKKSQPFYKNALNNDKVFIWEDKALIYRPSIDKIVDFGIIINPSVTPTSIQTSTPTPTPTSVKK